MNRQLPYPNLRKGCFVYIQAILFLCYIQELVKSDDLPPIPIPPGSSPPSGGLTTNMQTQLENMKGAIDLFKKEVDYEQKDVQYGIIHYSVNDFSKALNAKKEELKSTKPTCTRNTDNIRDDIDKTAGGFINSCYKVIKDRLVKAEEKSKTVKTEKELECLVKILVDYHKYKKSNITFCTKGAFDYASSRYKEEIGNINSCVNSYGNSYGW